MKDSFLEVFLAVKNLEFLFVFFGFKLKNNNYVL